MDSTPRIPTKISDELDVGMVKMCEQLDQERVKNISNSRQDLVNHETSNDFSCDTCNGFHNHISPNTAGCCITSLSLFISDKRETSNPPIKNALPISKPWPSTNTQKHEPRDVVFVLASPMWIVFFGEQVILFRFLGEVEPFFINEDKHNYNSGFCKALKKSL